MLIAGSGQEGRGAPLVRIAPHRTAVSGQSSCVSSDSPEPFFFVQRHSKHGARSSTKRNRRDSSMSAVTPIKRSVPIALVTCLAVFTLAIAPASAAKSTPKHKVIAKSSQPLPSKVDGVPLLDLAKRALGAAEGYSVSKPTDVRVVVSTQAALYGLVSQPGGSTVPEYIIKMQGRFTCGSCGTSDATAGGRATTTTHRTVRVSTMVLEVPLSNSSGTTGLYVGLGDPDLTKMGRVYNLDPYIASLAGVPVRIGPLPG
jgi:hypothetical protein